MCFRLRADESGFANVVLAGDWLRTGINGGCIEAATMGGLQAARRICGFPERIVGDEEGSAIAPMQDSSMRFVDRGGDVVLRPPYQQDGTTLYAFLLRTQLLPLQALADRYLNHGPVRYEAFAPFVALIFADIRRTYSTDPEDRVKGWMPERDVSFWVPLRVRDGGRARLDPFRWFLPYIWVDNGIAMAAGREVFGFPKELGDLVIPTQPKEASAWSVATDVLDQYGPDEPVRRRRIIEVTRAGAGSPTFWQLARDTLGDASGALIKAAGLDQLGLSTWPRVELTRLVFLKRFRDITDGALACHQSVVEASARPTQIRGGGMLGGDFSVRLEAAASHPFVAELLGADKGRTATLSPFAAFWVDFDFAMELGEEIWRAGMPSRAR